jgi:murein L,D-transpeptidase YcbB/YkuD
MGVLQMDVGHGAAITLTGESRTARALIGATLLATVTLISGTAAAQSGRNIDNWLGFDERGGNWEQPFDKSFVQQWQSEPQRGFPTISGDNIEPIKAAIKRYADIVAAGGWGQLPKTELRVGQDDPAIKLLRRRLEVEGDLRQSDGEQDIFDSYVEEAVKLVQTRNGIAPTGFVDKNTIDALNVPASARLRQLRENLVRVTALSQATASQPKYVVVNIPAAQVEAIENNRVASRHSAVVGKFERQTPILHSFIHEVNFNKEWIVPPTVLKQDLVPKGRDYAAKGKKSVLEEYGIDAYANYNEFKRGNKLDAAKIDWESPAAMRYFYVQNPGEQNPLGFVKINFHNQHSTYMHDTPSKSIFARNFRAESSGCVRVQNIPQIVSWLLQDSGWSQEKVQQMKDTGERLNVQLKKRVPLYFSYVTAWATPDNQVNFRPDLYRRDGIDQTASAY